MSPSHKPTEEEQAVKKILAEAKDPRAFGDGSVPGPPLRPGHVELHGDAAAQEPRDRLDHAEDDLDAAAWPRSQGLPDDGLVRHAEAREPLRPQAGRTALKQVLKADVKAGEYDQGEVVPSGIASRVKQLGW